MADNSFPSDFYRRLGALLLLGAIGVHYPLDVAVSAVIGATSAAISDPVVAAARARMIRH